MNVFRIQVSDLQAKERWILSLTHFWSVAQRRGDQGKLRDRQYNLYSYQRVTIKGVGHGGHKMMWW